MIRIIIQITRDNVYRIYRQKHMILNLWEILGRKGGEAMETFVCSTRVVSGEGALQILGQQNCRRLLIVTETAMARDDWVRQTAKASQASETECFDDVDAVPTMQQAVTGSRMIKEYRPDLVVALGGRNVLDCAKAMACFSGITCRLAAVPAAYGIGSEVTDGVLLSHNGRRHFLRKETMMPELAVLDSRLVGKLPAARVAEAGFEMLSCALECYASGGGSLSCLHAREGFSAVWASLPAAFAGNGAARHRLQNASVLTGMARNQKEPGLCSALENSLGIAFGLSRGKLAAILMPAIIGCNAHAAGSRYAQLARAAGLGGSREEIGVRNLRMGLIRLRRELGLPGTLVQAGVDIRRIWNSSRQVVEMTLEDPSCRNNPVAVDGFLVRRILEEITGRI